MKKQFKVLIVAVYIALMTSPVIAQDTLKIGVIATLEGAFQSLGEEGIRGAQLAIQEFDSMVGGKNIELVIRSSDSSPESATNAARDLIENENVQLIIGPLSGSEGIAIKEYAKLQPDVTFINGVSAAQDTTLRDPADNFFRFNTEGAQWMAGLGEYIYHEKGYRNLAVVAEDYSFPYTMVFGLLEPFCRIGGLAPIDSRFWVPIGTHDYTDVIAKIPDDADAIFVALGGSDAVEFISQYEDTGGSLPIVGSSVTVDQTVLNATGSMRSFIIGTPSAGPIVGSSGYPLWLDFVDAYLDAFPDGLSSPSLFSTGYYVNTKAAMLALEQVSSDLSDGGEKLRAVLTTLDFETPTGRVYLDERRNAVADTFISEIVVDIDGSLIKEIVDVVPEVNQTFGMDYQEFLKYGPVGRNNPQCDVMVSSSEE